jgi:uncharacterized protein (DUF58 family)
LKVSISKRGTLIYLAVLAGSLVFASFYGGPVSYGLLYTVLLIIPISIIYIILNFAFLRVYQGLEVHKITKGEDHEYRTTIENEGLLPIHRMQIYLLKDRCNLYEIQDGQEISLDIHEKKELNSGISCKYAGSYDIGIEKVSFKDPFGIFTVVLSIPYSFRAIVSPRITDMADKVLELENIVNSTGLKSTRVQEDTPGSDIRPYEKGDSLKTINWKVSAKLGELMTRVPDKMEKRTVTILMEASNVPERDRDTEFLKKRDYFLEFAVSAAWHFSTQSVPVKLIYPNGNIKEDTVDSYDSFMEFYNIVADGIFYNSDSDYTQLKKLVLDHRSSPHDNDTFIIIKEDPQPSEDHILICD